MWYIQIRTVFLVFLGSISLLLFTNNFLEEWVNILLAELPSIFVLTIIILYTSPWKARSLCVKYEYESIDVPKLASQTLSNISNQQTAVNLFFIHPWWSTTHSINALPMKNSTHPQPLRDWTAAIALPPPPMRFDPFEIGLVYAQEPQILYQFEPETQSRVNPLSDFNENSNPQKAQ